MQRRRVTYGEQRDRETGGFEGGVCLFANIGAEPCGRSRLHACMQRRRVTYGEQRDRETGGFEGGVCLFAKSRAMWQESSACLIECGTREAGSAYSSGGGDGKFDTDGKTGAS